MPLLMTPANAPDMVLMLDRIHSPMGDILVVCDSDAICALEFAAYQDHMTKLLHRRYYRLHYADKDDPIGASSRVRAYLAGKLDAVAAVKVSLDGTILQQRVWSALRAIKPGEVITYRTLAMHVGAPNAVRAVAHAVALNPINIAVPCHRVVGSCGTLRGYSGGLERKRWLLQHEGVDCRPSALRHRGEACRADVLKQRAAADIFASFTAGVSSPPSLSSRHSAGVSVSTGHQYTCIGCERPMAGRLRSCRRQ